MKVFIDDVIVEGESKGEIYIESDTLGFQVKTYSNKLDKKGNDVVMDTKHFMTVRGCVKYLVRLKLHESTATNLSELLQDVERIEAYIESKIAV